MEKLFPFLDKNALFCPKMEKVSTFLGQNALFCPKMEKVSTFLGKNALFCPKMEKVSTFLGKKCASQGERFKSLRWTIFNVTCYSFYCKEIFLIRPFLCYVNLYFTYFQIKGGMKSI